eukprot:SAG31_NODE_650_length_13187_cov_3.011843_12_plen_236_part_00
MLAAYVLHCFSIVRFKYLASSSASAFAAVAAPGIWLLVALRRPGRRKGAAQLFGAEVVQEDEGGRACAAAPNQRRREVFEIIEKVWSQIIQNRGTRSIRNYGELGIPNLSPGQRMESGAPEGARGISKIIWRPPPPPPPTVTHRWRAASAQISRRGRRTARAAGTRPWSAGCRRTRSPPPSRCRRRPAAQPASRGRSSLARQRCGREGEAPAVHRLRLRWQAPRLQTSLGTHAYR